MWEDLELRELQTKHKMQNGLTSVDHLGPTRGGPSPLLGLFGAHWNGSCRAESAVLFILKGCCFWPTEQKFPPQPWHALAQTHTYTHNTDTGGMFCQMCTVQSIEFWGGKMKRSKPGRALEENNHEESKSCAVFSTVSHRAPQVHHWLTFMWNRETTERLTKFSVQNICCEGTVQ